MTGGLDGNVLAGALGELFAVDMTTASAQCAGCGLVSALAQAVVYTDAPGSVARCSGCDAVLLRLNRGPGRVWVDLRGVVCLQVELGSDSPDRSAGSGAS
jgi:hypothetical protein